MLISKILFRLDSKALRDYGRAAWPEELLPPEGLPRESPSMKGWIL